jgi:lipoprotein signal peptidase
VFRTRNDNLRLVLDGALGNILDRNAAKIAALQRAIADQKDQDQGENLVFSMK